MNLQFVKKPIPYLRTITNEVESREQTQEVRLTDGMPDIGCVLACWGQVLIRGKEWRAGGITVNGGVMAWVMYMPEDGSQPQRMETWLPFQLKWDFDMPMQDGVLCVQPFLVSMDARSTSARKMMVRACVDVSLQARIRDVAENYVPDELPEDICVLENTYPMMLPAEGGEKHFTLEEIFEKQTPMVEADKILYYNMAVKVTDQKLLTDKLIFRGSAALKVLYMDQDGRICRWSEEVPFSQYTELDHDYTDHAESVVCVAITNLELDKNAEGKFVLKAGLLGQYTIYDRVDITVIEDAYSLKHKVQLQTTKLNLPAVLDVVPETIYVQQPIENMPGLVADVEFYPGLPQMYRDETGISGELFGAFNILGHDNSGQVNSAVVQWSNSWRLPADPSAKSEVHLFAENVCIGNGCAEAEIHLTAYLHADRDMPVVTGLEISEDVITSQGRPSLILCRKGECSLWDLAKMAGSTVEAIERANDLTQEPESDKMILIPVV